MRRREVVAEWLAEREGFHTVSPATRDAFLMEADMLLDALDRVELWTLNDVADWAGLRTGTVSSYRTRSQMPAERLTYGRTHLWEPDDIKAWRPHGYPRASR